MKKPNSIVECLPKLRLFARAMCPDVSMADQAVADCLARSQTRLSELPVADQIFLCLLTDLATSIRQSAHAHGIEPRAVSQDTMQILRQLPPHHRDVLIAVKLFNLRYWEAASVCGCPIGTVKSRLNRASTAFAARYVNAATSEKSVSQPRFVSHAGHA
jgi:RNA polymerase sigma-70 factor, ECF subfamily